MEDRLRPRQRPSFIGFTKAEIEKMETLLKQSGEEVLNKEFCQRIAIGFNRSSGRAGKPVVKWAEVQDWFQSMLKETTSKVASSNAQGNELVFRENHLSNKGNDSQPQREEKVLKLEDLEFEARSSKDGAWYDVELFLTYRYTCSGEPEVRVRYVGFGAEEDEWVNIKNAVRLRSIPLEHSECHKVKIGDLVLCYQERRDEANHYDAHVIEIQRRMHDIRGCRCLFLIRYNHDNSEEKVRLRRLCRRPA